MAEFRLFFLHIDGAIKARVDFTAPDDEHAWRVASALAACCADQHHGWMLWQGTRHLVETEENAASRPAPITAASLTGVEREIFLTCAGELLASHWPLAKSAGLKAAIAELDHDIAGSN